MALFKRNFSSGFVLGGGIATALVYFLPYFFRVFISGPISSGDMDILRKNWNSNVTLPSFYRNTNGNGVSNQTIQGFVFEASHIKQIINRGLFQKDADQVVFYLGRQEVPYNGINYPQIKLIAIGARDGSLLKGDYIFDHADPIPPGFQGQ